MVEVLSLVWWQLLIAWICIICLMITFKDRISKWIVYPVTLFCILVTLILGLFNP